MTEANNLQALPIRIEAPDLELTASVSPSSGTVNGPIQVSYTVTNVGNVAAPASWIDGIYLSADQVLGGDMQLGDVDISLEPPLGAGESYERTVWVTIPNTPAGSYYLLFATDIGTGPGSQGETNETNNFRSAAIEVLVPDLTISAGSVAVGAAWVGQSVDVSWTVTNQGATHAPADWGDSVYLSTTPTLAAGALLTGEAVWVANEYITGQTPLAAGDSYTIERSVTLPDFPAGPAYLVFVADGTGYQGETDESNNTFSVPILVGAPDLAVTDASPSLTGTLSGRTSVSWTVTNLGENPVGLIWDDSVYLSTDDQLGDDIFLGSFNAEAYSPLPGQTGYSRTASVDLPTVFPVGPAYLLVVTDSGAVLSETDETNNYRAVPIELAAPDLSITAATAPSQAGENERINVTWTVANTGAVDTVVPWIDVVYLSTTPDVSGIVAAMGVSGDASLAGGSQHTLAATLSVPYCQAGQYYIIFLTDLYKAQGELDETNNTFALPLTVSVPDLSIPAASAPDLAEFGQQVEVSWTVRNNAADAAMGDWFDGLFLSQDQVLDNGDTRLLLEDQGSQSPLAGGASYTATHTVQIPKVGTGQYYWIFAADYAARPLWPA